VGDRKGGEATGSTHKNNQKQLGLLSLKDKIMEPNWDSALPVWVPSGNNGRKSPWTTSPGTSNGDRVVHLEDSGFLNGGNWEGSRRHWDSEDVF
jgi:hypothetical protein